jgi:hypothetical protein
MITKPNTSLTEILPPQEIFNYINRYYVESFLSDVSSEIDEDYNVFFTVSASLEDTIYHLKFDSDGNMVHRTTESLIELYDEEYFDYD